MATIKLLPINVEDAELLDQALSELYHLQMLTGREDLEPVKRMLGRLVRNLRYYQSYAELEVSDDEEKVEA